MTISTSGDLIIQVIDFAGNVSNGTETGYVIDTTIPDLFLYGTGNITLESGTVYTDSGAYFVDNVDGT